MACSLPYINISDSPIVHYLQLIKQSQMILNFLALEGRISNDQIDCIWAAGQVRIFLN